MIQFGEPPIRGQAQVESSPKLVIRDIPQVSFDSIFNKKKGIGKAPYILGVGENGGVVFGCKDSENNLGLAVKIYNRSLSKAQVDILTSQIVYNDCFTRPLESLPAFEDKVHSDINVDALLGALGLELGHMVKPELVDAPIGIVVDKGKPIGYIMPIYSGAPLLNPELMKILGNETYHTTIQDLQKAGVLYDDQWTQTNSFLLNNGALRLIDLTAKREILKRIDNPAIKALLQ